MRVNHIRPINNNHLVLLEQRNANRLIHLAGKRELSSARHGKCIRSNRFEGANVLVSQGGIPYGDRGNTFFVPASAFIRVGGRIREPYLQIEPVELVRSELIIVPDIYSYSGWYRIIDIFQGEHSLTCGDEIYPLYGTPRLEMEDDTEYIDINGVGVVKC